LQRSGGDVSNSCCHGLNGGWEGFVQGMDTAGRIPCLTHGTRKMKWQVSVLIGYTGGSWMQLNQMMQ